MDNVSSPRHSARCAWAACALAAFAFFQLSCATSSGSAYTHAESGEAAAAREKKPGQAGRNASSGQPGQDQPSFSGWPDHSSNQPAAERTGGSFLFTLGGAETRVETGSLAIDGLESGSSIYVDGVYHLGSRLSLAPGSHELRIKRFGYRDFEAEVNILLDRATTLRVDYERAPFSISSLDVEPSAFDPADPGYLGSCVIRVQVAAPGEFRAWVLDSGGAPLRDLGSYSLNSPAWDIRWDGRDGAGRILPAGGYLVQVRASGQGAGPDSAEARVSIQSGLFARSTSLYSGVSGSLFAPDARSLGAGRLELASGAELHLAPSGSSLSGLGTAHAGLRFGLPSGSGNSELAFSYMGVFWQDQPAANSYSLTGAWKYSLGGAPLATPTAAAIYVKASIARFYGQDPADPTLPSWDGTTRYSGLSLGLPLEYGEGSVRGFLSPELEFSTYYPNWASREAPWSTPGFFAWAYLRLGLEASVGRHSIAFSGALRSSPFGQGLALAGHLPLGLEVRWHAPSSPLVLSLLATGEFEGLSSYYFGAGIGMGIRY
jgi:hypothetical protein